ncbi:Sulfite exporter TauE/SafE [Anaerohalosphaera lusitana]|uniref:Probable membrane transporter protein n=1 Tax=Anaerohalosphaera lusitana TaxID=1936003 RepID=A0A1U9NK97_9BACT|nr:sulfite exporter TauE/SafE family protein [Anaerohalosphaera lusitana]AQT68353.1 Sulfite exporter TauE/SafE [Anaerohalosphaera lusitana]
MDFVSLIIIGLVTGVFGGLLGIGGSMIMIPALAFVFGENQHLYQAAAMITNFFVSTSSLIAHRKAEAFVPGVLKWMIPAALAGIVGGVAMSNMDLFAGENSYLLARVFGVFLIYVVVYNLFRFKRGGFKDNTKTADLAAPDTPTYLSLVIGFVTGTAAGLLGIGAGGVCTPLQQVFAKMPLKRAMSNSAAIITSMAWLGAAYKNLTLGQHGIDIAESLKIAGIVIPTAILGGFWGGHLMHAIPRSWVRAAFILIAAVGAVKMLTVSP